MRVGVCGHKVKCHICKKKLKATSKYVDWSSSSGRIINRRTSGFECSTCKYFYVLGGMEKDDSGWEMLTLVQKKNSESSHGNKTGKNTKEVIKEKSGISRKEQKGIYPARFPDSKSCQNCYYFTKHKTCVTHRLKVEEDEWCYRYKNYLPKIYLGGSFSPR